MVSLVNVVIRNNTKYSKTQQYFEFISDSYVHLQVVNMVLASYTLRLEQALVSDHCSNFWSPDNSLITHLPPRPLFLHSISSYLNFWIPSIPLPFRIVLSTYFWLLRLVRSWECKRGSTFVCWSVKKNQYNSIGYNFINFFHGKKAQPKLTNGLVQKLNTQIHQHEIKMSNETSKNLVFVMNSIAVMTAWTYV